MKYKPAFVKILFVIPALLLIFAFTGCGSALEMTSTWPAQAIQIDGNSQDWQGSLQVYPKEDCSIGFRNDGKFLYLCFITSSRSKILHIMRSGLNVVFESSTVPEKDYTIRFPLINPGMLREAIGSLGPDAVQKEGIGFLFQELLDKQTQFYIVQKEFLNTVSMKNKENIEVKMGTTNEQIVYELKVPLAATESSFAIGAMPGEKINVKFETDPAQVAFREGQSAGQTVPGAGAQPSGGAKGGRGGAKGGSVGGQPAGGDTGSSGPVSITEKFSVKIGLQLAKEK